VEGVEVLGWTCSTLTLAPKKLDLTLELMLLCPKIPFMAYKYTGLVLTINAEKEMNTIMHKITKNDN
jgi:hypothetical protein